MLRKRRRLIDEVEKLDETVALLEKRIEKLEDIYETLKVRVQVEERRSEIDKRRIWLRGDRENEKE